MHKEDGTTKGKPNIPKLGNVHDVTCIRTTTTCISMESIRIHDRCTSRNDSNMVWFNTCI
jgi:hypothetical protein